MPGIVREHNKTSQIIIYKEEKKRKDNKKKNKAKKTTGVLLKNVMQVDRKGKERKSARRTTTYKRAGEEQIRTSCACKSIARGHSRVSPAGLPIKQVLGDETTRRRYLLLLLFHMLCVVCVFHMKETNGAAQLPPDALLDFDQNEKISELHLILLLFCANLENDVF